MKKDTWPQKAIILAAGRGRRLRPYTDQIPKPLLPIEGRPMLDITLQAAAFAGITQAVIITHYLADQIKSSVGNGQKWGMSVSYTEQTEMLGTAHALQGTAAFIDEPVLILAADYILPLTYLHELKSFHLQQNHPQPITISLKQLSLAEQRSSSSIRYGENGRITEIIEKPAAGESASAHGASLIYIVPAAITDFLQNLELSSRGEYELPAVLNRMIQAGYPVRGLLQEKPAEWEPHFWPAE
ncbi:MAG: nucleotidyltransferase family protein [Anaerolineales bacterium]|nr:nucleotidyltransferase family protein [Anaerolineales bacterium]